MKNIVLALFVLAIGIENIQASDTTALKRNVGVCIVPSGLFDGFSRLRLGVDFSGQKGLGVGLDISHGRPFIGRPEGGKSCGERYRLYEIRPEVRYFFPMDKRASIYAGVEGFYQTAACTFKGGHRYYIPNTGELYPERVAIEQADFYKRKWGGIIKSGIRVYPVRKFSFDFYCGVGFARRLSKYSNVVESLDWNPNFNDHSAAFGYGIRKEGEVYILQLALGLKLAFTPGRATR